jgi:hypothetical protein
MMRHTTRALMAWLARVGVMAQPLAVEMSPRAVVWVVRACVDDIARLVRYEEDIPLAFASGGRAPLVAALVDSIDARHARIAVRAIDAGPAPAAAMILDSAHARIAREVMR